MALTCAASVAAPPGPGPHGREARIEARVEAIKVWLLQPRRAVDGGVLPTGATRAVTYERRRDGRTDPLDEPGRFQLTAACRTLHFLARYQARHGDDVAVRQGIDELLDRLRRVRSEDARARHAGALASELPRRQFASFPNALCGQALLETRRLGGEDGVRALQLAIGIGGHFLRLLALGREWSAAATEPEGGEAPAVGLFDRVTADGRVQVTSSTWNLAAAPFLRELTAVTGEARYAEAARQVEAFHRDGVLEGYDYYAHDLPPAPDRIRSWNLGYAGRGAPVRHDFGDGRWHRHGDIRRPPSGTVGTDQIEYGLQAMAQIGEPAALLRETYRRYRGLPNATACLDAGVSFSGYFRLFEGGEARHSGALGSYYDIVGAGLLAELKRAQAPEDYRAAIDALLANWADWAMLDCALEPVWSGAGAGRPATAKRSVLVAATSGLALLQALEPGPERPPPVEAASAPSVSAR